jgi:hypothetical protein
MGSAALQSATWHTGSIGDSQCRTGLSRLGGEARYCDFFLPRFRPPLRLADLPALAIRAARDFDMPFRLSALYFFLFLTEAPAITASTTARLLHRKRCIPTD